jgi:hypothetical protein
MQKLHSIEECHLSQWQVDKLENLSKRLKEPLDNLPIENLLTRLKEIKLSAQEKEGLFWLYVHFKDLGLTDLFKHSILNVNLSLSANLA